MASAAAATAGVIVAVGGTWSNPQSHLHRGSLLFNSSSRSRNSNGLITSPPNPALRIRNRRRMIQVEASKKQTFSSLDELLQLSDKPVLVDFYATWCGPCQFMAPVLNEVSISMADTIQVVKIDTEKYPEIADKYNIAALPTFILFKDGKPFDRFEGALTADQLVQRIQDTLKLDA